MLLPWVETRRTVPPCDNGGRVARRYHREPQDGADAAEVAELLNVSKRLVYQLVSVGDIPHFRVGAAVRFEPKALSLWLRGKLKAAGKEAECHALHSLDASLFTAEGMTGWSSDVLLPKAPARA
jgi:excisionase family DNA binding protein